MAVKTLLALCACVALAFGAAIESRAKRQADQAQNAAATFSNAASGLSSGAQNIPGLSQLQSGAESISNLASSASNGASAIEGFQNIASAAANGIQGIAGRIQNAFNQTYQDERDSVSDSFNSVKDQLQQGIQTGANLTKTAFDLGTIVPKFGKNIIIGN